MAILAQATTPSSYHAYRLQLVCPPEAADIAQTQLRETLEKTGLDDWFTVAAPICGPWALLWDDRALWRGEALDEPAWEDALLEGWWGEGGGCC